MPDKLREAILAVLPVAVIYFSGWAYLASYLGAFGVDATQIEVPLATVLVYAFVPLSSPRVIFYIIIVLSFLALWSFSSLRIRRRLAKLSYAFGFVALLVLLLLIQSESGDAAQKMAETVWHGRHLQNEIVPAQPVTSDSAYEDYATCRSDSRLQQVIGFPQRILLLCRSEIIPCERGAIFLFDGDGRLISRANIAHENRGGEDGCENSLSQ